MPIIESAKKQLRQSLKKRANNFRLRRNLKDAVKAVQMGVKEGDGDVQALVSKAYKVIDNASKHHILHRNTADRKKSQVAKWVAKMGEAKVEGSEAKPKAKAKPAQPKAPAKKAAPKKAKKA